MPDNQLNQINHIVVLMLENRSFDHMLGYLSLPEHMGGHGRNTGADKVDGLTGNESNDHNGQTYPVFHLDTLQFPYDPPHDADDIAVQIGDDNGGFVKNFADSGIRLLDEIDGQPVPQPDQAPGQVMGYYTRNDLPVFDLFAEHFAVCDQWYSSLPGPTWPNRQYAMAGTSEGRLDNPTKLPGYTMRTVFEALDENDVSWGYYYHDFPMLVSFERYDHQYALNLIEKLTHIGRKGIADVLTFIINLIKRIIPGFPVDAPGQDNITTINAFFDSVAEGTLPAVAWIDPNFELGDALDKLNEKVGLDIKSILERAGIDQHGNDDHPAAHLYDGQRLVGRVYNALRDSSIWNETLLIITYDEHGGFYDHVSPPPIPAEDDGPTPTYGVRVPALIVSPYIARRTVSNAIYDHASIISTILARFHPAGLATMPVRVRNANHVGDVLTEAHPRTDCPPATMPTVQQRFVATAVSDLKQMLTGYVDEIIEKVEQQVDSGSESGGE